MRYWLLAGLLALPSIRAWADPQRQCIEGDDGTPCATENSGTAVRNDIILVELKCLRQKTKNVIGHLKDKVMPKLRDGERRVVQQGTAPIDSELNPSLDEASPETASLVTRTQDQQKVSGIPAKVEAGCNQAQPLMTEAKQKFDCVPDVIRGLQDQLEIVQRHIDDNVQRDQVPEQKIAQGEAALDADEALPDDQQQSTALQRHAARAALDKARRQASKMSSDDQKANVLAGRIRQTLRDLSTAISHNGQVHVYYSKAEALWKNDGGSGSNEASGIMACLGSDSLKAALDGLPNGLDVAQGQTFAQAKSTVTDKVTRFKTGRDAVEAASGQASNALEQIGQRLQRIDRNIDEVQNDSAQAQN